MNRPTLPLFSATLLALCALSACNQASSTAEPQSGEVPKAVADTGRAAAAVESDYGTPVKDRVATLGFLNKRNNETQELVMKTGEARRMGNTVVKLATCEKSLPWERPAEVGAFVQLYVEERIKVDEKPVWHKVFSGWLFKNAPSLNVVEHPVYDVWVKDCAMKFPGEEENPADAAAAAKAAKPAGKESAAPAPAASPSSASEAAASAE